jgi:2,3-bisphosphoglycerate-independent phosphoglycerate mutase
MTDSEFKAYQEQIALNDELLRSRANLALVTGLCLGLIDRIAVNLDADKVEEIKEALTIVRKIVNSEFYPECEEKKN